MVKRRSKHGANASEKGSKASTQESSVSERGQTVIPKSIREALGIEYGTRLQWEAREGVVRVIPIPKDPVKALRGALKGRGITFESFLRDRQLEREKERQAEEKQVWHSSSTPRQ